MSTQTPQQAAEQQREQSNLDQWEQEDARRKGLLRFLWTNRKALSDMLLDWLERKLNEPISGYQGGPTPAPRGIPTGSVGLTSDDITQRGPMFCIGKRVDDAITAQEAMRKGISIPTERDTAAAILSAKTKSFNEAAKRQGLL